MDEPQPHAGDHPPDRAARPPLLRLALGAIGVVFGDIGTSPLYSVKECFHSVHGVAASAENVLGVLSLITWSLLLVVSLKYLTFITRADNQGEGGILALLALLPEKERTGRRWGFSVLGALIVFGAALLYGDGVITPAISVLSAVEGLEVAAPGVKRYVVGITCAILFALFAIQRHGTQRVGRIFGPVMVVWFLTLAGLGVAGLARHPAVLGALNPLHAVHFFSRNGFQGFELLGAVVLAITGGEALYADLGHFGRGPITVGWYGLALPALLLNYFGQGAQLLTTPEAAGHPFFALVPTGGWTYALVALSTAATVIASQALISGAYSLTHQAMQLDLLPRLAVKHTSSETEGQIYIPQVNRLLALSAIALVLTFRESSRLAAAYGLAVTGTMAVTSIGYFAVMRMTRHWSLGRALPLLVLFLAMDLPFFGANLLKFLDGGYVPVLVATVVFAMMLIWRRGRMLLYRRLRKLRVPMPDFIATLQRENVPRVPGTAVFLTSELDVVPQTLTVHLRFNKALHQQVILLTLLFEHTPRVVEAERYTVRTLGHGVWQAETRIGYLEFPDVPTLLAAVARHAGITLQQRDVAYYVGRESFLATGKGQMGSVTETLFGLMVRNSRGALGYFRLPSSRVVELGIQLDL